MAAQISASMLTALNTHLVRNYTGEGGGLVLPNALRFCWGVAVKGRVVTREIEV
jgi:hypothetical protein